jgi:hypothetical protein
LRLHGGQSYKIAGEILQQRVLRGGFTGQFMQRWLLGWVSSV